MTERGFTNVAFESAHAFRAIMQAMARPGHVMDIGTGIVAPEPLLASAAAVALTLCDFQTPVWLAPELRNDRVRQFLRFHAGVPITEEIGKAHFVFATAVGIPTDPRLLPQGTHEYPDRSATLIIQATEFTADAVELSGPGIRGSERFGVAGLDAAFWAVMAANHVCFPTGIDVIFAAPGRVAALPRSTAIRVLESV